MLSCLTEVKFRTGSSKELNEVVRLYPCAAAENYGTFDRKNVMWNYRKGLKMQLCLVEIHYINGVVTK